MAAMEQVPVPVRHRVAPNVLTAVTTLGLPFIAWGLVVQNWFLDRMALLHDDVTGGSGAEAPSRTVAGTQ